MFKSDTNRALLALNVASMVLCAVLVPRPAQAYFIDLKKTALKLAVCGGLGSAGKELGEKLAEFEAKKLKLSGEQAAKHRRAYQIGMAAALCGAGVALTDTIYATLSKRDRKARETEMAAALADTNPGVRTYVLPDSGYQGRLVTDPPEQDGDKECRIQVDFLSKDGEPARARWCRKSAKDKYDLDLGG